MFNLEAIIDRWAEAAVVSDRRRLIVWVAGLVAALLLLPVVLTPLPLSEQACLGLVMLGTAILAKIFTPGLRLYIIVISVLASLRYLVWRFDRTLNLTTPLDATVSLALFGAECYGVLILLLGYFQTLESTSGRREPVALDPFDMPGVDVFITTLNEDVAILRRTITGALAMDYPRMKVYLLDDGHRDEMRDLARSLGCLYISRPDNRNAKAGNLNYALSRSTGELVAIFDADHVPVRSFLREVVGHFRDPRVALVQTPHHFFNPDPFERNLGLQGHIAPENDYFYQVVQVGNDFWGSAFFCGSCAVLRRSALRDIGGVATDTVTEDAHTALNLHGAGYRSVYYSRTVAAGLATERFVDFVRQRMRWSRGMIQILRRDNPLFKPGLAWPQRLNYFNAMVHFLFGIPRLVFIVAPLAYLYIGLNPIRGLGPEVLGYALPHIAAAVMASSMLSRSYRNTFWAEVYESAIAFFVAPVTLLALLSPRSGRFVVTAKGAKLDRIQYDWRTALPVLTLLLLAVVGLFVLAPWRWLLYPDERVSIAINALWTLYGTILLVPAALVARERPQQRRTPRITRRYRCHVVFPGGAQVDCHTRDLSETGVRLEFERPTPLPDRFDVEIENPFGPPVRARGVSVWRAIDDANRLEVGFELLDVSAADRLAIIRLMFSDPNAWMVAERPPDSIPRSLWLVVTSFFTARRERKIVSRAAPRLQVVMSCRLTAKGQTHEATTENLSELGALLRFEGRLPLLPPYAELALHVTDGHVVRCEAHIVRRHYSGGETLVAVRFHRMTFAQRRELGHFLYRGFGGEPVREARAETVDERRAAGRRAAIFSRVAPPPIAVPSPGTAGPRLIRRVEPPR